MAIVDGDKELEEVLRKIVLVLRGLVRHCYSVVDPSRRGME